LEGIAEDEVWELNGQLYGRTNLVPPYSCARIAGAASVSLKGTTFVKEAGAKTEPSSHCSIQKGERRDPEKKGKTFFISLQESSTS
jgi:hypothetical protein